jgi:hypothetical protein
VSARTRSVIQCQGEACLEVISSPHATWWYATRLRRVGRVGILAFQTACLRLPRAVGLVLPNGLVLRWVHSTVYSVRMSLPFPERVGPTHRFHQVGKRVCVGRTSSRMLCKGNPSAVYTSSSNPEHPFQELAYLGC